MPAVGARAEPGMLAPSSMMGSAALIPARPQNPDAILYPPPALTAAPGRVQHVELTVESVGIEIARGKVLHAWAYNGTVPGPTIRVTEGDILEVVLHNRTDMAHTIHFHGIHPATVDGTLPPVAPGASATYRFTSRPFGLFVYHCHMMPIEEHISRGMYGVFIIDPAEPRPPARELVMLLNGYDLEGKQDNQFYSVNGPAGYYGVHPIPLRVGELTRVYIANMTEFDPINSFHLHANVFKQIPSVKAMDSAVWDDTVMLCQGQRSIVEFTYDLPGLYLMHAHQSDISEKGWAGFFEVS